MSIELVMLSNHLILCCRLLLLPSTFPTQLPSCLSWWRIRLQCKRPWFSFWVGKIHWRSDRLPTPVFLGFPCGSAGKESACNAGDLGFIPGLGRSPGEGKGYALQYSGPGEFHGLYCPWGCKESDTTEWLSLTFPSIGAFSIESLHIRWPKYWSFIISPSNDILGWFPLGLTECFTNCRVYSAINPLT